MKLVDFIKRNPLGTYVVILFVWIAFWAIAAISVVPPNLTNGVDDIPPILLVTLLIGSPSFVAVILTVIMEGTAGIARLLEGFAQWRISPLWYAVACSRQSLWETWLFCYRGCWMVLLHVI